MNTKYNYVIIKEGVYRHEIIGVYTKAALAEIRACEFIKAEHDDYHSAGIYKCPLNQPLKDGELYAKVTRKDKPDKTLVPEITLKRR